MWCSSERNFGREWQWGGLLWRLEEVIQLEYLGESMERCLLFWCEWYDPSNPWGTQYSKLNCTYEINIQRKYAKYDPFIIGDVAYQVFYIPYPRDIPHKANWWAALLNKPRQCPNMQVDAVNPNPVFQEDVMASTSQLSETLPQFLANVAGVMEEVWATGVGWCENGYRNWRWWNSVKIKWWWGGWCGRSGAHR